VVDINTVLIVSCLAGFVASTVTIGLVLIIMIYNNTKEVKKEEDNDDLFTVPYSGYGGGGGSGQTVTLGDLIKMSMASQAAKDKETPKADVGGGQYL